MPPGERTPRRRPAAAPDGTGQEPASIRPRAVEVPLPESEPEPVIGAARFRVLISIDGWTAGEEIMQPPIPRTAALVGMGYLAPLGDR
jgi:hypothetical protein